MNTRHFFPALARQAFMLLYFSTLPNVSFFAAVHPEHGSKLTTTQVMFEFENVRGASTFELAIFEDNGKEDTLQKPLISKSTTKLALLISRGLLFGKTYKWRFRAFQNGKLLYTSPFYQFQILSSSRTNNSLFTQQASGKLINADDLVLIDHAAMAINRQGEPVWFMPLPGDLIEKFTIRDLNLTTAGTFTYLDQNGAYERYPDSTLLWKGPDNGLVSGHGREDYHHQLTKLADGSFVVCGFQYRLNDSAAGKDAPRFNTLIHYNSDNSIRWQWSEIASMASDKVFSSYNQRESGGHLNGFAFSPDLNRVFMSFKNLSDVFVLNTLTGNFEASIKSNHTGKKPMFLQQHGPYLTSSNELLIYNNNIVEGTGEKEEENTHPSVQVFRYDTLRKQFQQLREFEIRSEKHPGGISGKEGYVSESSRGNMLVCTGGANYTVELDRSGKKQWECYFYKKNKSDSSLLAYSNYRCHSIRSLYPVYFTLQYRYQQNGRYYFLLYNAGSMAGEFDLYFYSDDESQNKKIHSRKLAPGHSELLSVPVNEFSGKQVNCRILTTGLKTPPKTYLNLVAGKK